MTSFDAPGKTPEKKVLMIVTSDDTFGPPSERPTGVFFDEAIKPMLALEKAGYKVDIASPKGGAVPIDPVSFLPGFQVTTKDEEKIGRERLSNTLKLSDVEKNATDYDGVWVAGGHGDAFDLKDNKSSQNIIREEYEAGKPVAAICHAGDAIANVKLDSGEYLVNGKHVTGFTDAEEAHENLLGIVPKPTLEAALKSRGALFENSGVFEPHAVQDGNLITGQSPPSIDVTTDLMLKALKQNRS